MSSLRDPIGTRPEYRYTVSRRRRLVHAEPSRARVGLVGCVAVSIIGAVSLSGVVGDLRVATISLSAVVAGVAGGAGWTVSLLHGRFSRAAARAALPFAVFIATMLISLLLGHTSRQGVQFLVVQAGFLGALLVASAARRTVGPSLDPVVARCFRFTSVVLGGATLLSALGIGQALGGTRPTAIVSLIGMGWFLAEYGKGNRKSLWWALGVLITIASSLSRTALLAGFAIVVVSLLFGSRTHRTRNTILCALLVVLGSFAVTSWAPLHDRFVKGDVSLSVGGIGVNAEGRTRVWAQLWGEVPNQLILGHGPGTASDRSASLSPLAQPHNDYLRLLYDFGVLGFGSFGWFVQRTAKALRRLGWKTRNSVPALAGLYAGLAILIMMATDNPLDYPFVMLPLGALIGLGLGSSPTRANRPASKRAVSASR